MKYFKHREVNLETKKLELRNKNMTEQNVEDLYSWHIGGKRISVPHQTDVKTQREFISSRLIALVDESNNVTTRSGKPMPPVQGTRGMFKTALDSWIDGTKDEPWKPGKYRISIYVETKEGTTSAGVVDLDLYVVFVKSPPLKVLTEGQVHPDAVDEIGGLDTGMTQALKIIFNKTSAGRTAPGTTRVNHIHVGGNAQKNILFYVPADPAHDYVVLGIVDGHMDSGAPPSIKNAAANVSKRRPGDAETMKIAGSKLTLV